MFDDADVDSANPEILTIEEHEDGDDDDDDDDDDVEIDIQRFTKNLSQLFYLNNELDSIFI